MRSKEHLWNLRSFWVAICVPVALACFVWGAMYRSGLPDRCWSPDCFNYAFELFKVPLAILALIFPAVALVASHHRSVQTAAQIKASQDKNTFENYFKHREYFSNLIDEIEKKPGGKMFFHVNDDRVLYKKIFPSNSPVEFFPLKKNNKFLTSQLDYLRKINDFIKKDKISDTDYEDFRIIIIELFSELDISEISIISNSEGKKREYIFSINEAFEAEVINFHFRLSQRLFFFISELVRFSTDDEVNESYCLNSHEYKNFSGYREWTKAIRKIARGRKD